MQGEKSKYKYFGNGEIETMFGTIKKFGQEFPLYDDEALDILQHGGIVRSEDFDGLGWTPLEKSNRNERTTKNAHYMECHQRAMAKRKELMEELAAKLAAQTTEEVPVVQSDNF